MLLIHCVNAYTAIQGMASRQWDYQTAHALMILKRRLHPHAVFYAQQEAQLVQEYAARDEKGKIIWNEKGRFVFQDSDRAGEYSEKRDALGAVQVQEEFAPIRLPVPDSISPIELEALEGFVQFGEENEA